MLKEWDPILLTFLPCTTKDLGLAYHLGHGGCPCPCASGEPREMVVLHTNGIHQVHFHPCKCVGAPHIRCQLLRRHLYPATILDPRTCATFALLREFHILSLQSKISMHHFYLSLHRRTDNTGLKSIPVSGVVCLGYRLCKSNSNGSFDIVNSVEWPANGTFSSY
jgi:hypothetical protein